MIIIAQNQTGTALSLTQLSVPDAEIPASGSANLTDYNKLSEILDDYEIVGYINDSKVLLQVDGTLLTKEQSLSLIDREPTLKSNLSAIVDPTSGDDKADGYSIGSLWVNTSSDSVFVCTDNSTGAASWASAASGSGITAGEHEILRQLIHFIEEGPAGGFASGAYKETLPAGNPFPTSEVWWESSSKLKKIVELTTTWSGVLVSQEQWKVYDTDGSTVLQTVTDSYTYSGVFETSRTRTIA